MGTGAMNRAWKFYGASGDRLVDDIEIVSDVPDILFQD